MNTKDKRLALLALAVVTVEWVIFKIAYPFPDFFSDSYSYIYAALMHLDINIWPIGYSKFLTIFHSITHSDTALVTFQFYALESAALYLYITTANIYDLSKTQKTILFALLFCNPMSLYLSNYITTESLFCALSLLWITELIQIVNKSKPWHIYVQAIIITLAYALRYNASYYPIVTIAVIFTSCQRWSTKFASTTIILIFLGIFVLYSREAGKDLTGKPLTSILSGWQLANNALYMRGQINVDSTKLPSVECRQLDSITRQFFKRTPANFQSILKYHPGNYFIQDKRGPLKTYMSQTYHSSDIKNWALTSPIFAQYGKYLIKSHPIAYTRYFVWMNISNFIQPPLEKLVFYNMNQDSVWPIAQYWFHYKSTKILPRSSKIQQNILFLFPTILMLINFYFIFLIAKCIYLFKRQVTTIPSILLPITIFWTLNFLFSILANIVVLRYQFFPFVITGTFCIVLNNILQNRQEKQNPIQTT